MAFNPPESETIAMTKRPSSVFLPFFLFGSLLLGGCPTSFEILIYNNSFTDFIVHYQNSDEPWKSGALLHVDYDQLGRMEWVHRADGTYIPTLVVSAGAERRRYRIFDPAIPSEQYWARRNGDDVAYLQVERDGGLYAIVVTDRFPAQIPRPQPAGYPIAPLLE